jgi:hypothetical protein
MKSYTKRQLYLHWQIAAQQIVASELASSVYIKPIKPATAHSSAVTSPPLPTA